MTCLLTTQHVLLTVPRAEYKAVNRTNSLKPRELNVDSTPKQKPNVAGAPKCPGAGDRVIGRDQSAERAEEGHSLWKSGRAVEGSPGGLMEDAPKALSLEPTPSVCPEHIAESGGREGDEGREEWGEGDDEDRDGGRGRDEGSGGQEEY